MYLRYYALQPGAAAEQGQVRGDKVRQQQFEGKGGSQHNTARDSHDSHYSVASPFRRQSGHVS